MPEITPQGIPQIVDEESRVGKSNERQQMSMDRVGTSPIFPGNSSYQVCSENSPKPVGATGYWIHTGSITEIQSINRSYGAKTKRYICNVCGSEFLS